ncbi:transporter [Bradyrhizobium sp. JYMT SZCCT0428]|uniref:SphA family protein n=1 Tax=Bradyrhizobium sp. JYMT SZCCT0428 TaxID=2807673 RepID=UPI001BA517AD|nr:transporter [Bradyrhizobium sp. JYMT SZCCT0428]MBR1149498.1 transporter [Bradyrhizobium sp. JYMT SZCCT0428]
MMDRWSQQALAVLTFTAIALVPLTAKADNGGIGFWLPGTMGSLSAVPGQPGMSYTFQYIHLDATAGGGKALQNNSNIVAGLRAKADVGVFLPTYTFATPVLGGQLTIGAATVPGNIGVDINATLTGPRGNTISGSAFDNRVTWGDVYYIGTLKWNFGVHNLMTYVFGNIPTGTYDSTRLANLSPGFVAVDSGAGYTYLNPKTGQEFTVVGGFSFSGTNTALDYRNGIDFHADLAASQFIGKSVHAGVVGYVYQQVTGDTGTGAKLGANRGTAIGIGPQIGFFFPTWEGYTGYLNLRGYADVFTENRPANATFMATLSFAPAAPEKPVTPRGPRHLK